MGRKLTSKETAKYLNMAEYTLRRSRMDGVLFCQKAPPYIKMGSKVLYDIDDIDAWSSLFMKINSTKQDLA